MVPLMREGNRWLTAVFVVLNLSAFAAVNAFWQFLSTGRWINYGVEAFRHDMALPLGQMLLTPLSIFNYPWMTLVTGFLLAVVIFVPILVAVLYRLRAAAVFVLIVAVLGHAPVLAGALAIGCFLSARTPLRSDMPFLAVLLGMVPVAVYLYLFGLSVVSEAAVLPLQRGVAGAPFLIALLSASLASLVAVIASRASGYRQWVFWPVVTVLMSGPMTVFYTTVGTDELKYSLITSRLAPGDAIFKSSPLEAWLRNNASEDLADTDLLDTINGSLETRGLELIKVCQEFAARYPDSQRAPALLWVAAQCYSLKVSKSAFEDALVMYYASHVSNASQKTWAKLVARHPGSPQAALAHWRLGQLALRDLGQLVARDPLISKRLRELAPDHTAAESAAVTDEATAVSNQLIGKRLAEIEEHLATAEERLVAIVAAGSETDDSAGSADRVFLPVPLLPTRGYYRQALVEVKRLRWLIRENKPVTLVYEVLKDGASAEVREVIDGWDEALNSKRPEARSEVGVLYAALTAYTDIDANGMDTAAYRSRLEKLLGQFEGTNLGDNLIVAWSNTTADPYQRARLLIPLAEVKPPTDAAITANFHLGILTSRTADAAVIGLIKYIKDPLDYFKVVIASPENPWQPMARERKDWLEALEKKPEQPPPT